MSHASLTYPGHGNHFYTVADKEFLGDDGYWYRIEIWHEDRSDVLKASAYRREKCTWIPAYSQRLAMEKRALLEQQMNLKEAA